MNMQTIKAQTKKPRVAVDLALVVSVVLTVLAALPYQLGDVATIIPAAWKPVIALAGVIASAVLGAIRPYMPSPHAPTTPPEQTPK